MKVKIDDLQVAMELRNKGIVLTVYDNNDTYRGKLKIGKGSVEWCKGRTRVGNGIKINWNDFIAKFEES